MSRQGRLPVVLPPESDERLSSWLDRLARFYAMTVPEFLAEFGLPGRDVFDLEWMPGAGEGARIAGRTGLSDAELQAMSFREITPEARMMIARTSRHHCPLCPADVKRRATAFPWTFQCPVHGIDYRTAAGATLSEIFGAARFMALDAAAKAGAAHLAIWARGEAQGEPGPVKMLTFLTARHRRASPPSVSEQPRLSLQARRDHHDFLTMPIVRQALAVVVPDYDHVAPVLAKPVRPGRHGLSQGSLLQAYALTVGIGRLTEDPVDQATAVLLASDADGEERLRVALKSWPLPLRRRISARLWRAQRDERDRKIAQKVARPRQSQKLRLVQSHRYRG